MVCGVVTAQTYPTKSVRIVVPFPPGSGPDVLARTVAQKLPESLSQPVIVENRAGAGGIVATELVAKSAPDGYTLLMGTIGTHALNVALYKKLPYDAQKDFAPVSQLALLPHVVLLHPSVPAKTVKEFVAFARARPGQINYASAGTGTGMHLSTELMKAMAKIDMVHVPYKGPAESMAALLGGEAMVTIPAIPATLPLVKAGRVRALAVTSAQRSPMLRDIPTMAESGFPGFDFSNWSGVFAPAGVSPQIVRTLSQDLTRIVQTPDVAKTLVQQGAIVVGNTPEQFASNINVDLARWMKVVKDAKLQID
jgi:tripartite-type tricarboxylate transporter receptor subunit TctC